jgi:L-serine deaminase
MIALILNEEEAKALETVLAFVEGIVGVRPYQPRHLVAEKLQLVRGRLEAAIADNANGGAARWQGCDETLKGKR